MYVDNKALYICGGGNPPPADLNTTCQVYNAVSPWYRVFYAPDTAVQRGAADLIKSAAVPWGEASFLQVGGKDPQSAPSAPTYYNQSYLYTAGEGDNIAEDVSKTMKYPRAGHCFVRTRTRSGSEVYVVIGGLKPVGAREDATNILYVHCEAENCADWEWREAQVDGLGELSDERGIDTHTCASFEDEAGEAVIMVVSDSRSFVLAQSCEVELKTNVREDFTIMGKAPTMLKA